MQSQNWEFKKKVDWESISDYLSIFTEEKIKLVDKTPIQSLEADNAQVSAQCHSHVHDVMLPPTSEHVQKNPVSSN